MLHVFAFDMTGLTLIWFVFYVEQLALAKTKAWSDM